MIGSKRRCKAEIRPARSGYGPGVGSDSGCSREAVASLRRYRPDTCAIGRQAEAGLVIAMRPEQFSRQHVVDTLRHAGWPDLADEASRTLPDPVDAAHLEAWGIQHGISYDVLQSRFGGSP